MYYDEKPYNDTLFWYDIFESAADFIEQVNAIEPAGIGGISDTENLTELYSILSNKYLFSHTRYMTEAPFIFALKRELYTEFPFYLEKKSLVAELIALTDADIELQTIQLRNLVDTHDETITNADKVAIDDLSTQQENMRVEIGKLQAKRDKYNMMNRDFIKNIYSKCDGLFRVILASNVEYLYEED